MGNIPALASQAQLREMAENFQSNQNLGLIKSYEKCCITELFAAHQGLLRRRSPEPPFRWKPQQTPTLAQKEALLELCQAMRQRLQTKSTKKDIAFGFMLLTNGLKISPNQDPKGIALAYGIALEGVAADIFGYGIREILLGRVKDISRIYLPATAELRHYFDELTCTLQSKIESIEKWLMAPPPASNKA